jgi:hypothetical protein
MSKYSIITSLFICVLIPHFLHGTTQLNNGNSDTITLYLSYPCSKTEKFYIYDVTETVILYESKSGSEGQWILDSLRMPIDSNMKSGNDIEIQLIQRSLNKKRNNASIIPFRVQYLTGYPYILFTGYMINQKYTFLTSYYTQPQKITLH